MAPPKISIITPSYNQGAFLKETIESVLNQKYSNLEYIVMDGGSKDSSVEVIREYEGRIAHWESKADKGQADAINRGIAKATGDIVAFLNSDDVYLPGALATAADFFMKFPSAQWLAGGVLMFGESGCLDDPSWWHGPQVAHSPADWVYKNYEASQPSHFWKRSLFAQFGGFNEELHYCFDHEFYVRLAFGGVQCHPIGRPLAAYRFHRASKTVSTKASFEADFTAVRERYADTLTSWSKWQAERKVKRRIRVENMFRSIQEATRKARGGKMIDAWLICLSGVVAWPGSVFQRAVWGGAKQLLQCSLARK